MAIPSIGGDGGNSLNKIHINPSVPSQQAAPQPVAVPTPMPAETEVEQTTQQPLEQTQQQPAAQTAPQPQQADNTPPVNQQPEQEKEYSVKQFRTDYANLLESKVIPILSEYEEERKKRLAGAITGAVFFGIAAICVFLFVDGRGSGDLFWGCIAAACGIWYWIKKSFEKKIKKRIMPILMHAIPGFFWQETPPVKPEEIEACMILPFAKKCSKKFDDCFLGKYRDVKVAISECEYELGSGNNSKTILEGVIIKFSMNKNFEGTTIIRPKKPGYKDKYDDLKRANMTEVKLEDPEFSKKFVVYSTDQIEARYLITTAFMERFKQIETAFSSKFAYASFYKDSVFIAPHTGTDLFNLCSLVKPIGNREQFETLFNEFVSILALVDHFKLDKKLGL